MTKFFGTGVATSKDWTKAAEADGMTFTAYESSQTMLQRNATCNITISAGGAVGGAQENHSGRRSLHSKARKEMSEFERTYPW